MRLIGVDPGLTALGLADMRLDRGRPRIVNVRAIHTAKAGKEERVRVADDMTERLHHIAVEVDRFFAGDPVLAICIEIKNAPRGHDGRPMFTEATMTGLGRVRGLFDHIAARDHVAIVDVNAQTVKRVLTGSATAEKETVIKAVGRRFPEMEDLWPERRGDWEHVADAIAILATGLQTDVVKAARALYERGVA